jgi:hypothetical protein
MPFLPAGRVGLATAIAAFTIGSAYVDHDKHEAGSVEPGKCADLVVLVDGTVSRLGLGRGDRPPRHRYLAARAS